MTPEQRAHRQGTIYMLLVIGIWGGFLPVGKSALQAIDPYWLSFLRFGTAALVFLGLLAWREGRQRITAEGRIGLIALVGACGFAGFGISLFEGLRLTRPEIAAMILATGPIQMALVQWWRSGRRPDDFTLAMIALAVIGEGLVVTAGNPARLIGGDALGNGLVLLASLFWTAYTLGGQAFPGWTPVRYTALSCALGSIALLAALAVATAAGRSSPPAAAQLATVWPELLFIVFCVSVFGILFWNMGVAKLGPINAGLFANFAPVITYLIALAQGRRPDAPELAGALIVLAALVANNRHQGAKARRVGAG
jgi:drug/metabolite transporter (DMT)-like permease